MSNPLHSDYCNCECPAGNSYDKLERTLNRVRMVHIQQSSDGVTFCTACVDHESNGGDWQAWPCETMQALEGCKCPPELLYKGDHYANCVEL
jgi:hypothetical protein